MGLKVNRLIIIDLDGLQRDVFRTALAAGELPNMARITGGRESSAACHVDALSTAPSITFAAQASIVTGKHPAEHGIPGNESFDRLGRISKGRPRHFGFDVGDTLAVDDAVAVFTHGLASRFLAPEAPTLYEIGARYGMRATVAYHMYARGAETWMPPNVVDIARFTKGRGKLGMEAGEYDTGMLDRIVAHLKAGHRPDILTAYFMGLDHHSHLHGPSSQPAYLREIIDPQIGRMLDSLEAFDMLAGALFVLVSDHGQIDAIPDDRHSLRLGFPFDLELVHIFKALGLDVHDYPGEDPHCDAVMGLNGGLAHVYLQHREKHWADAPRYQEDILPVAQAFHEMNVRGRYAGVLFESEELHGTLDLILVRDTEHEGWQGMYRAYLGDGLTQPLADFLAQHPELSYADPINRLRLASSAMTGDLILLSKGAEGFYFGGPACGVHGGLYPGESEAVLTFAYPDAAQPSQAAEEAVAWMRETVTSVIADRCANEANRRPSVADMVPAVRALFSW